MNRIWIITKRELAAFFDSLIAYIVIIVFLGLSGFFTWLYGNTIFLINQANLQVFFGISYWSLFFFIPAISMRMLAEEKRTGTIELLSTKSVTDWEIVTGKFLACLILVLIALATTLPYYITVSKLGSIDHGATIGGYLGLIAISAVYISIGIFASSLSHNQIISFLIALFIGIFFHLFFDIIASTLPGGVGEVISFLSTKTHFDSLSRGVIDSRDLVYFISLTFLGLLLAQTMISKRNWAD